MQQAEWRKVNSPRPMPSHLTYLHSDHKGRALMFCPGEVLELQPQFLPWVRSLFPWPRGQLSHSYRCICSGRADIFPSPLPTQGGRSRVDSVLLLSPPRGQLTFTTTLQYSIVLLSSGAGPTLPRATVGEGQLPVTLC